MTARRTRLALLARTALVSAPVALLLGTSPATAQSITFVGTATTTANGASATGFGTVGNTLNVTLNNSRTILDWDGFNLASDKTLNFVFGSRGDVVLNRVASGTATIDGALNGYIGSTAGATGGNVWFSAPGGVVFGADARVNVGGLLATTGSITNTDFLGGDLAYEFSGADSSSSVTVDTGAQLNVSSGTLALVAPTVTTASGSTISGGSTNNDSDALFGAAEAYTITFTPDADGDLDLLSWTVPAEAMGSDAATPIALAGTTSAGNVYVAAVSRRTATTAAINISGTVTANGATASADGDIVLAGGAGIASGAIGTSVGRSINATLGALTSSRDVTLQAGNLLTVNSPSSVGRNYAVIADDFTGTGVFTPNFGSGTTNDLSITDTAGGLFFGFGGRTVGGTLNVTATNGGGLAINGALTSTNESINLSGSLLNLGANLTANNGAINVTGPVRLDAAVTAAAGASIAFSSTIDGAFALTANTTGNTSFGGNIGSLTPLTMLTTSAGGITTIGGNVTTTGQQTYNDAVTIPNTTTLATTGGTIALNNTVNGPGALTLSSFGTATLGGAVGGSTPLASLTTGNHPLNLNGGSVTTGGAQSYAGAVTFGANTTLTSNGSGNITLGSSSNRALTSGGQSLAINTFGNTVINGVSGNPLSSLSIDPGGSVTASSITTTGAQTYNGTSLALAGNFTTTNSAFTANGPVTFGGGFNTISTGSGAVSFGSTVDGVTAFQQRLTVNSTGATTFSGNVGSSVPLLWLASDIGTGCVACGSISLRSVSSLTQQYFDTTATLNGTYTVTGSTFEVGGATTLAGATTVNASSGIVEFGSTINGAQALDITGFSVAINGNVGATTALASINANSAGSSLSSTDLVFGGSLRTSGNATLQAKGNVNVTGALNVSGDYSVTGQDFLGNALSPTFVGTTNDFTIVDTAGGLMLGAKTVPGTLNVTTTNGGALTTSGALVSTNESINLTTTGGGNISLGGNLTTGTAAGRSITFNGSRSISYTAGSLTTNTLTITAANSFSHGNVLNNFATLAASSAGDGLSLSDADSFTVSGNISSGTGQLGLVAGSGISVGSVTLQASGTNVVLLAPSITLAGSTLNAGNIVALGGNTSLTGSNLVSAPGNVSFQGTVNGPGSLTVNAAGETQFQGVVGGTTALASLTTDAPGSVIAQSGGFTTAGDLTFNDAAQITGTLTTGNGNFTAGGALTLFGNVIVNAGSGNATFGSTVDGVIANGRSLTVNSTGATSFAGAVGSTAALSSLTTNAGGTTSLRNVTTSGAQVYNDAVTLNGTYAAGTNLFALDAATIAGDTTITAGTAGVTFSGPVDGTVAGAAGLNVTAGTGIIFGASIGSATALRSLSADAGSLVRLGGTVNVMNGISFADPVQLTADTTMASSAGGDIVFEGALDSFGGTWSLAVNTSGTTRFDGAVGGAAALSSLTTDAGGQSRLGGNLAMAGAIALNDAVALAADVAVTSTSNGAIALGAVTGNDNSLDVTNGTGAQTFNGITGTSALTLTGTGARTLNGGTYTVAGGTAFDFGGATLNGALTFGQATTFGATTLGSAVTIDGGAHALTFGTINGGFGLTATTTGALSAGAIGDTTAPTAVTLTGGSLTANGATSSGDINLTATTGDLTLASGVLTAPNVVLSTSGAFVNQAGAGAINAGTRWLVYSANPADNSFGGLDSGTTALWNGTLATRAPGTITGNRYVFAQQPTLTFTSTDTSKTYGDLLALSNQFSVSGLQPAVAGAYLADTAATAYAGAPTLTSAGTAANAAVAGVPYAIGIAQGTLSSDAGYAFAFNGTGQLSVTPKALTVTATASNKTYDGTTAATGSLALGGVVGADAVTATGSFAFADKNVGTGKTVSVTGATLSGADAGNYTLTLPGTAVADILAKAISATVTADNKTYDVTTAATGSATLAGVVAGDTVATSGGNFVFADKNAGTGKTVNVSGITLTGADAGNYTLTLPGTAVADILAKALTATVSANSKTYDGTTAATGNVQLSGVVAGDAVAATGGSFAFADKNAGTGKTVNVSGVTLSGADAGNYTLVVPATTVADILRRAITVTADAKAKASGAVDPALTFTVSSGSLVAGDALAGGLSRAAGEAPGAYAIDVGTLSGLPNYEVTFVGSTLTIQPAAPTPPEPTPPTGPSLAERMPESLSDILDRVDFRTDTGLVASESVVVEDREYACGNGEENCRVR